MKLINPTVNYIPQLKDIDGMFRHIELCGRTCYKSEDKITEDSAQQFVNRLIKNGHTAMLEHGTVYLTMRTDRNEGSEPIRAPWYRNNELVKQRELFGYVQYIFKQNPYSVVKLDYDKTTDETTMYITTNYRVIIENHWEAIMNQLWSDKQRVHEPRITLKFITNIGVTREGNRMRANSIAEESTRYCNYTKDKFGNEITFCKPSWISAELEESLNKLDIFEVHDDCNKKEYALAIYQNALEIAEQSYFKLINLGWTPQQAREVLPLATKSEVVYTAFPKQWCHFFNLRLFGKTGAPHPNMKQIAECAKDVLVEAGLWNIIDVYNTELPSNGNSY